MFLISDVNIISFRDEYLYKYNNNKWLQTIIHWVLENFSLKTSRYRRIGYLLSTLFILIYIINWSSVTCVKKP